MEYAEKRERLVRELVSAGVLRTKSVMAAFRRVRREDFVPEKYAYRAYEDEPLPTLRGQTISQPYTVAAMTEALQPKKGQKILEVGSGSGYQAAILAEIAGKRGRVVTMERIGELAGFARNNLSEYENVVVIEGDGTLGYEKESPYDRIIVTASSPSVPGPLVKQLKDGGVMVMPVGSEMLAIKKTGGKTEKTFIGYYSFVPLIGKHGHKS